MESAGDAGLEVSGCGHFYWLLGGASDRVLGADIGPLHSAARAEAPFDPFRSPLDRILIVRPRLHSVQRGKNYK